MGLTNKYVCPISQDITDGTATTITGTVHQMQGKNISGGRVSAVIVASSITGAPFGRIEMQAPDNTWHPLVAGALLLGATTFEAPRWPTMRIQVVGNGSGNSITAFFAENSG